MDCGAATCLVDLGSVRTGQPFANAGANKMNIENITSQQIIATGYVDGKLVQLIAKAGWHHLTRTATLHVNVSGKTQRIAKHYTAVRGDTIEHMRAVGMRCCNLVNWQ
jgi:hypothetical protein